MSKNDQKIADVNARLAEHNRKNNMKMIAKAIAINVVAPIVAATTVVAINQYLENKDK